MDRKPDYLDHIVITPGVRSGKPCIRNTRIAVYDVLDYLASGMSIEEIVAELTADDITGLSRLCG